MSREFFRFLVCGDLHLGEPLGGIAEVPEHLEDLLLDARHLAAEKVFDAAVAEKTDFVLLAGHALNFSSRDARSLHLLLHAFERLAAAGIDVYWCDTDADRLAEWPRTLQLPANVHPITGPHPEPHLIRRGDRVIAKLVGTSARGASPGDLRQVSGDSGRFTIGLAHCPDAAEEMLSSSVDLWAVGGSHQRIVRQPSSRRILSPGSPQGGTLDEPGAHGCLVVTVDHDGKAEERYISTDVVRWVRELIELPDEIDLGGLLRLMRERALRVVEQAAARQHLVEWIISDGDQTTDTPSDVLVARLRQGGCDAEILNALRAEFGAGTPGVWSLGLTVEPPSVLPSGWYEEDTVLGDLLRSIQLYQDDPELPLTWEIVEHSAKSSDGVGKLLRDVTIKDRLRLLRSVAALGVDLLRGDRVLGDATVS
jgi:DNA repair exonuclease SbcCD nuclease subunit